MLSLFFMLFMGVIGVDIILTKSDLDYLNLITNKYSSRDTFKEMCLQLISIKIHSLVKLDVNLKDKYYNRVYKLSYFCDKTFSLEDDVGILFLERENAQYSYIEEMEKNIPKMQYICCLYDDTYVSNSYVFYTGEKSYDGKDIISMCLKMYGYEHNYIIESNVKDRVVNKIINDIKNDIKYNFLIEKCIGERLSIFRGFNERHIAEIANSFVKLKYSSLYEAIYYNIETILHFKLDKMFKAEVEKCSSQLKSLNTCKQDMYDSFYKIAKKILDDELSKYSFKGILLLDELYKIGHNIMCNINRYNIIMGNVQKEVLNILEQYGCKTFKVRFFNECILCCSAINVCRENSILGLNYKLNDLMIISMEGRCRDLCSKMQLTDFKDFEITYRNKTIYKLSDDMWNNLNECKENISKLCDEQLELAKTISNTNC